MTEGCENYFNKHVALPSNDGIMASLRCLGAVVFDILREKGEERLRDESGSLKGWAI
jgi:hypothetical protein